MRRPTQKRKRRSGAAVVELAMILPLFLLLVLGQLESARLGMSSQLLTTAARDGCRYAVINGNNDLNSVQTRINQVLTNTHISVGTLRAVDTDPGTNGAYIIPSTWASTTGGQPITVVLRVPYTQVSWLARPVFLTSAKVLGTATLSSERP